MDQACARLILAAAEALGGEAELALYMGIDELELRACVDARQRLPYLTLLCITDLVMTQRRFIRPDPTVDAALRTVLNRLCPQAA